MGSPKKRARTVRRRNGTATDSSQSVPNTRFAYEHDATDEIDTVAAGRLAARLKKERDGLCRRLTPRLLAAFPEIARMLKLEGDVSIEERLNEAACERFCGLVQAICVFESLSVVDQEFRWAIGVLPRNGVSYDHQMSMVRWFFEELRRLGLEDDEAQLAREMESYITHLIDQLYREYGLSH
jgi:hypothetical protein